MNRTINLTATNVFGDDDIPDVARDFSHQPATNAQSAGSGQTPTLRRICAPATQPRRRNDPPNPDHPSRRTRLPRNQDLHNLDDQHGLAVVAGGRPERRMVVQQPRPIAEQQAEIRRVAPGNEEQLRHPVQQRVVNAYPETKPPDLLQGVGFLLEGILDVLAGTAVAALSEGERSPTSRRRVAEMQSPSPPPPQMSPSHDDRTSRIPQRIARPLTTDPPGIHLTPNRRPPVPPTYPIPLKTSPLLPQRVWHAATMPSALSHSSPPPRMVEIRRRRRSSIDLSRIDTLPFRIGQATRNEVIMRVPLLPNQRALYAALNAEANALTSKAARVDESVRVLVELRLAANSEGLLSRDTVRKLRVAMARSPALQSTLAGIEWLQEDPSSDDTDEEACSVCLDTGVEVVTPCDHKFHQTCIDGWLTMNRLTCPMCRVRLSRASLRPFSTKDDCIERVANLNRTVLLRLDRDEGAEILSHKLTTVMEILMSEPQSLCKTLILSRYRPMLISLAALLNVMEMPYFWMLTRMDPRELRDQITNFERIQGPAVLLAMPVAASNKFTMPFVKRVVVMDPWRDSDADKLAMGMVCRVGQVGVVDIYKLVSKDTVEERIVCTDHIRDTDELTVDVLASHLIT